VNQSSPIEIGFLLFPNVTQLDMTGPLQVLHAIPGTRVSVVAKSREPVVADCGLTIMPTYSFEDAPEFDVFIVPGGFGVSAVIGCSECMDYVRRVGSRARVLGSVCTGAFVLGAAGLLQGRRATTHWAYHDLLEMVGATPVAQRVVRDGNVFTGGGVTAGIDFGLVIAGELTTPEMAQRIQLGLEYDPAPPFSAGHPDRAPGSVTDRVDGHFRDRRTAFQTALGAAMTGGVA
jgi:cyclohexyl-isocyanide hydratase